MATENGIQFIEQCIICNRYANISQIRVTASCSVVGVDMKTDCPIRVSGNISRNVFEVSISIAKTHPWL